MVAWATPRTWVTNEVIEAAYLNETRDNLLHLYERSLSYAVLQDRKTTNTGGGSVTANAWTTRDLNTEQSDADAIVSIASNRFTPIAGTYLIRARVPFVYNNTTDQGTVRLYNFTAAAEVLVGEGTRGKGAAAGENQYLEILGVFTANGTDSYAIQYYSWNAFAASLGVASNRGSAEIYTQIVLEKIG